MGHGKETPRQKMIGLMYLFLTCMLALNVSKDILNAFIIVNDGLNHTTVGFSEKTSILYNALEKAAQANPAKAKPWNDKAVDVRKRTQIVIDSLQMFKDTIIRTADGLKGKNLDLKADSISSKDNTDYPAQIMVGAEGNGKGKDLKKTMDSYREFLLGLVGKDSSLIKTINEGIDTKTQTGKEGEIITWESHHFEHLPLIAVITIMSQMQATVRNLESDVVAYLNQQVDAGSFKFNKLAPTIIPNSNYVMQGSEYKAEIFFAAFDTTQAPEVFIGEYDSTKNSEGGYDYKMRPGAVKVEIDKKTGKPVYSVRGGAVGEKKYRGIISMKGPNEKIISQSFKSSFQIAQTALVVSPTKMNVFYIGVENPVDISVPGIPSNKLSASMTAGSIVPNGKGGYTVKVTKPGTTTVNVSAKMDGGTKSMGSKEFRVKRVPDPVAKVAGQKGGGIAATLLKAAKRVDPVMENFDFDLKFQITGFVVSTKTKDGFTIDKPSTSERITSEQKSLLEGVKKGQKVYFEEIKAKGPDGSIRELGTLMFKVE